MKNPSRRFIRSTFRKSCLLFFIALSIIISINPQPADSHSAQESSPQDVAHGLSITQNANRMTAGLSWTVQANDWPSLFIPGGVKPANSTRMMALLSGNQLGKISLPGGSGLGLSTETTDWAHNEMVFNGGAAGQLNIVASRLTPALLVKTTNSVVRLFTGNVDRYRFSNGKISSLGAGPSSPKYVAFETSGGVQTSQLNTSAKTLSGLSKNWLLVWYGQNSHIVDTKIPLNRSDTDQTWAAFNQTNAYQADVPVLMMFERAPASIRQLTEGGIELSFTSGAGNITLTPLLGRNYPSAATTELWSGALPASIYQKATWWANRLCQYPLSVTESYNYLAVNKSATITETFSYQSVCSSSTRFAPLPPMLGIAKNLLTINYSNPVIDSGLRTEFGPVLGIDNVSSYTWGIENLNQYVEADRMTLTGSVPQELRDELAGAVNKMIAGGHYLPWIFMDAIPHHNTRGDIYWLNPADQLQLLVDIAEALPLDQRGALLNYIRTEKNNYPPDVVFNLPLNTGRFRGGYSFDLQSIIDRWQQTRQDVFLSKVPIYNAYALARFYSLTGDPVPGGTWANITAAFNLSLNEQDWASMYWFQGYQDRKVAVWNANRYFAGLAGYIRLAQLANDVTAYTTASALLAKATVLRLGMAYYPHYLEASGIVDLPPQPDWQVSFTSSEWFGHLFNYHWTNASEDARQVAVLDQFGVWMQDHSGFDTWDSGMTSPYLVAFRDMVPELARVMKTYASDEAQNEINKITALFPQWYASFAEGELGVEHNLSHPIDAYQTFMAKAQIANISASELEQYVDIPWLQEADLFYMNKLSETIKQYQGIGWIEQHSVFITARPGDRQITLNWYWKEILPSNTTWKIEYQKQNGPVSIISNLPVNTHNYTLTGLDNYVLYRITITAEQNSNAIVSGTLSAFATDIFKYLSIISR